MTDIALVVLDTVRKDAFDRHFDWLPGTRFDSAWSTSHWTGAAHASLLTGQYPSEAGVTVRDWTLSTPEPTLAERLSEADYHTRAFSANLNVSPAYGYDRGFDSFEGTWRLELPEDEVFNWFRHTEEDERPAPVVYADGARRALLGDYATRRSLRLGLRQLRHEYDLGRIDSGAAAFRRYVEDADFDGTTFLFANLMEAHQPYRVPEPHRSVEPYDMGRAFEATFRGRFDDPDDALAAGVDPADVDVPEIDGEHAARAYDDCLSYLSGVYRDAFARLREAFDYVITVSDHGELFGRHGVYEHGYGLYPELVHVPLVVSGPGFQNEVRSDTVSLLDIHRTVLSLARGTELGGRGRDLRTPAGAPRYLTEYHGIAEMRRETLLERGYDPEAIDTVDVEFRGLVADDYYGHETDDGWNEVGDGADAVTDPEAELAALRGTIPEAEDGGDGGVDPDTRSQLEDLGYT